MSSKRPLYCWDTCVFVAHFKEELDKPLEDIRAVLLEVEQDKADLLISVTTLIELLDIVRDERIKRDFTAFLKRHNVALIDVNWKVAECALSVRCRANDGARNIKVPDAQIIGTAELHKADVLHTFDPKLLAISETPIVNGVKIVHPIPLSGQKSLRLRLDGATSGSSPAIHYLRRWRPSADGRMSRAQTHLERVASGVSDWTR